MAVDRLQRRMAAILAADVVGYSRLMGEDEEATLATLKAYREVIDGLVARHVGRIFGSGGDSVIAEFASPVEAVRCATEIQLEIGNRNADLPEANRMRFRIGINLGDVVVDGANLMGDGVNVAARLEALAPPGGICISEAIHAQVRDRLSLDFLDMGEHKVKNIARPVRAYRVPLASEEEVKSPFRGLDVFEFNHADLFFGRARAIAACIERLEKQAANGKAFLLIYGMSGSGKSSLLRAGLLPAIIRPSAGITLWRRCLFRPSEGSDAIASLAAGLLREGALPEFAQERSATELAELLRGAPDRALASIRAELGNAAKTAGSNPSQARLALAVDQMEDLFTTEAEPGSREALVRLLATLAGSGLVWVIGTIRADFFHRCGEVPGFSALRDGLSSYELLPPTGPEIAQIIREPARAAGLRFEETADQGRLEDVLQEAASADPGSLPLLEFVLDALYETGRDRRLLTFAAYRALGGLEGAIARRADEVVDALAPHIQGALPAVLRALSTVRLGDEAITAGPASLDDVAGTPAQAALVKALIAARLLASGEDAEGHPVIRVAHEALLTRWPRARDIVNANRDFLETRARVQADARRWHSDRKNHELLLPPGKRLAEAEELLLTRRDEIDDRIVEYVDASSQAQKAVAEKELQAERARIEAEEAAKRERLEREAERRALAAAAATRLARRTRYAAVVAILLAAIAGTGAFVGFRGQQEAIRQAAFAQENSGHAHAAELRAIEARNQAVRDRYLSLSYLSQQTAVTGDTESAILLAREALPKDGTRLDQQLLFEAEAALYGALLKHQQIRVFRHDAGLTDAAFDPAGTRIVTSSLDKSVRIWNLENESQVAILTGHQGSVDHVTFSPAGDRVITAGRDGTARIWNSASGKQMFVLHQAGNVRTAMFSPDGAQVLTASDAADPTLWDAETGKENRTVPTSTVLSAHFNRIGDSFATTHGSGERSLRIWNAKDGTLVKTLQVETWPDDFVFSPDGSRILVSTWGTSSNRETLRLADVASGMIVAALKGNESDIHGSSFSHDGRIVATASVDGTARLWDAVSGRLRDTLGAETVGLKLDNTDSNPPGPEARCVFAPDDRLLATAGVDNVIRIWDAQGRAQSALVRGHTGLIERVAFSPDGNRLLTASRDGTARLWDVDGVLTTSIYHRDTPTFAMFSPDGRRLLTGGGNNVAGLWDTADGRQVSTLETNGGPPSRAVFSPDGRAIATGSPSGQVLILDAADGNWLNQLQDKSSAILNLQFGADGRLLLGSSVDGTLWLWDVPTGTLVTTIKADGILRKAILSPDGRVVLAIRQDSAVQLWTVDGSELQTPVTEGKEINTAVFSPDGRLIATGSFDGTVRIWPLAENQTALSFEGHTGSVTDLDFSIDGHWVVSASRDKTIRLWDLKKGNAGSVLREPDGVTEVQFSPNSSYLLTVSPQTRRVKLWSVDAGREIALLAGASSGTIEPAMTAGVFSDDGTRVAVVSGDKVVRIVRVFPTSRALIDYSHQIVPRELTSCERRRFFLPVEGVVENCPG